MSSPAPEQRPEVLVGLMHGYDAVRAAWSSVLTADTPAVESSPHMLWRAEPFREPTMAWHMLLQGAELAATATANAVSSHLALLSRAYWPDVLDERDDPIPFPAAYPPARAVVEGLAVVGWVFDPALPPEERALRSARLLLWSQVASSRPEARWHEIARTAGFDVRATKKRPDNYFVWTGQGSSGLSISEMVRAVHGEGGATLYSAWNPLTHPDPIALVQQSYARERPGGYAVGGMIREDRDVEVGAHVAELVAAGIVTVAGYLTKGAERADDCRGVAMVLRDLHSRVVEAIRVRNAGGPA